MPDFATFFAATNRGLEPFPWQARLARRVLTDGWPSTIGVPTGLGKTVCIDIAIWALSQQASRPPAKRTAPTRTWYVVNRRLLVDTAHERGRRIARLLDDPDLLIREWPDTPSDARDAVAAVAVALSRIAAMGATSGPLHVARLRGGIELGARSPDPSQPCVLFATVPQFASRWLFRGYGTSRSMQPVDAALAGIDALILLDEAHLSRQLFRLAETTAASDLGEPTTLFRESRAHPRFVALTATADDADQFDLDAADLAIPIIARRVTAAKPTDLVAAKSKDLAEALVSAARGLHERRAGSSVIVFCNTPVLARDVAGRLERDEAAVVLVTGRTREREAARLRAHVLDPNRGAPAGRDATTSRARSLTVIATQTLEVGADLDFDFLVTESCGVRALIQRLGRLNRLGERPHAAAIVCHPADRTTPWPVYDDEPAIVWKRLNAAKAPLDLGPSRSSQVLGTPADSPNRIGELLPQHLWELAKTNNPPPGAAPVEVFFNGIVDPDLQVSVCWRAHLPADAIRLTPPIRELERVDLRLGELRELFHDFEWERLRRVTPDGATLETIGVAQMRPGDTIVLHATAGLYDESGWNPQAHHVVLDVGAFDTGILILDAATITALGGAHPTEAVAELLKLLNPSSPDDELEPDDERHLAAELIAQVGEMPGHAWLEPGEWNTWCQRLDPTVERPVAGMPYLKARPLTRATPAVTVRVDAFDELSFIATSVLLAEHLGSVGATARSVAEHLGLDARLVSTIARAGAFHDLGKADRRFQRWLDPNGTAKSLVAKSARKFDRVEADRVASGWPRGGRHEMLSGRLVQRWLASHAEAELDRELLLHLVVSHHGHGRPWIPIAEDTDSTTVTASIDGEDLTTQSSLAIPDWEQPRRFRTLCERYGVWGVALFEAIVRQADHAVSSVIEVI